jgi:hypothetical protein
MMKKWRALLVLLMIAAICAGVNSVGRANDRPFTTIVDGQIVKVKAVGCRSEWILQYPRRSFEGIDRAWVCRDSVWVEYLFRGECQTAATVMTTLGRYATRPTVEAIVPCHVDTFDGALQACGPLKKRSNR